MNKNASYLRIFIDLIIIARYNKNKKNQPFPFCIRKRLKNREAAPE